MSANSIQRNTSGSPQKISFHSSSDVFAESTGNFDAGNVVPAFQNGPDTPSEDKIQETSERASRPSTHGASNEKSNVYKKLENIKAWSVTAFKCTKQVIEEKLGAATPTCDEQLDLRIEALRQMQRQYRILLDDVRRFSVNLAKTLQAQREFAGHLAHVGQQQPELTGDFACNAELQRNATINGEKMLCVLEAFCDGLSTLVNRTFEDTMLTIRNMNSARIEFDAYRKEVDTLKNAPKKPHQSEETLRRRLEEALNRFHLSEENFFDMKTAVDAKIRLLHENRVRVMQHNLLLLNKATSAYFSGETDQLDETLKQFNVKITSPQAVTSRWSKLKSAGSPRSPGKNKSSPASKTNQSVSNGSH